MPALYRTGLACFEIFPQKIYLMEFVGLNNNVDLSNDRLVQLSSRCPLAFCGLVTQSFAIEIVAVSNVPSAREGSVEAVHCDKISVTPHVLAELAKSLVVQKYFTVGYQLFV